MSKFCAKLIFFFTIRLGIKALGITTALNSFQQMAGIKLFNKLAGVTSVNVSLLLPGRFEVLEDNFSRALQGLSQRQHSGEEQASTWFTQMKLKTVQPHNSPGAWEHPACPQKGLSITS